jgi:CspA family cold shock protein
MIYGHIKAWNDDRGFGFIRRDDGQEDVFCHCRDIRHLGTDRLAVGQPVEFDLVIDDNRGGKSYAVNLLPVKGNL